MRPSHSAIQQARLENADEIEVLDHIGEAIRLLEEQGADEGVIRQLRTVYRDVLNAQPPEVGAAYEKKLADAERDSR